MNQKCWQNWIPDLKKSNKFIQIVVRKSLYTFLCTGISICCHVCGYYFLIFYLKFVFTDMTKAEMITDKGTMLIEFYDQDAPIAVKNFVDLSKKGFYDGLIFHRVIPDFMVQGGDPTGTGRGGPGYTIKCELKGGNQYHDRGVLSMAHAGRDTGGSQFFICHSRNNTAHLDGNHTCFGKVVEGVDTVDLLRQGDKIQKITIIEEEIA